MMIASCAVILTCPEAFQECWNMPCSYLITSLLNFVNFLTHVPWNWLRLLYTYIALKRVCSPNSRRMANFIRAIIVKRDLFFLHSSFPPLICILSFYIRKKNTFEMLLFVSTSNKGETASYTSKLIFCNIWEFDFQRGFQCLNFLFKFFISSTNQYLEI